MTVVNRGIVQAVGESSRQKTDYIHWMIQMHAKVERLEQELKEREERDAPEEKDVETIRTLHIQMAKFLEEKDGLKKKLRASQNELKGTQTLVYYACINICIICH